MGNFWLEKNVASEIQEMSESAGSDDLMFQQAEEYESMLMEERAAAEQAIAAERELRVQQDMERIQDMKMFEAEVRREYDDRLYDYQQQMLKAITAHITSNQLQNEVEFISEIARRTASDESITVFDLRKALDRLPATMPVVSCFDAAGSFYFPPIKPVLGVDKQGRPVLVMKGRVLTSEQLETEKNSVEVP
jgi:hypothetical protein